MKCNIHWVYNYLHRPTSDSETLPHSNKRFHVASRAVEPMFCLPFCIVCLLLCERWLAVALRSREPKSVAGDGRRKKTGPLLPDSHYPYLYGRKVRPWRHTSPLGVRVVWTRGPFCIRTTEPVLYGHIRIVFICPYCRSVYGVQRRPLINFHM